MKRSHRILLLVLFAITFALFAGFLAWLLHLPWWVCAPAALIGLYVNALVLRWEDGDLLPKSLGDHASQVGQRPRG